MSDTSSPMSDESRATAARGFLVFLVSYGALALFAMLIITLFAAAVTAAWSYWGA